MNVNSSGTGRRGPALKILQVLLMFACGVGAACASERGAAGSGAAACPVTLEPVSLNLGAEGASDQVVKVTTPAECPYDAGRLHPNRDFPLVRGAVVAREIMRGRAELWGGVQDEQN